MGRRGPPPKPRSVKELQGTLRKHREARNPPQVPTGEPVMPQHLGQIGRAKWREIVPQLREMGLLSPVYRTSIEMLCLAYEEYRVAAAAVRADGGPRIRTYVLLDGKRVRVIKNHPTASVRADAWRRYMVAMREFGLSAAASGRVEADVIPPLPPPPAAAPAAPAAAAGGPPSRNPAPDSSDPYSAYITTN